MKEEITVYKNTKDKILNYIIYFFIYSFLGWIIESIYAFFVNGYFVKRGFLYGPICPIYGFGAVLLIMTTKKMDGRPIMKFLISTISFTIFEYFVSLILEILFGLRWWDYSNDFLNIYGRVSLLYSIVWGIIGVLLLEKLHPLIENIIKKIENKLYTYINIKTIIVIILIILIITDTVFSSIRYLI